MKHKNCASFFQNHECEYFPCHKVENVDGFNCLFCYCPLYVLGSDCGGNFTYTETGIKDCSNCTVPHRENSAEYMKKMFPKIVERIKK
jgi:Zn-finger protein